MLTADKETNEKAIFAVTLLTQLVQHCTGITEEIGSNSVLVEELQRCLLMQRALSYSSPPYVTDPLIQTPQIKSLRTMNELRTFITKKKKTLNIVFTMTSLLSTSCHELSALKQHKFNVHDENKFSILTRIHQRLFIFVAVAVFPV